ncbi:MAG: hypothetical protein WD669_11395 [Pirellulales bacterium]
MLAPHNLIVSRPLLAAILSCLPSIAFAQPFRTDPVDNRPKVDRPLVAQWVTDPAQFAANQQRINDFFTKFLFPAMTRTEPNALADAAELREELFKKYLWASTNEQIQKNLTGLAYNAMLPIVVSDPAQPPYDPIVRYNALLVLGLLDEQYPNPAAPQTPQKPLLTATAQLLRIVNSAATNNPYPPQMILGALLGLERHATLRQSLPPQAVDAMTTSMLNFVSREAPPPNVGADVHAWMRLRAAAVLAQLGRPGNEGQVYNALLRLVATLKSLDDRCDAAALLDKLKYEGAKVDGAVTAQQLLKLSADVAEAEIARAIEFEEKHLSGGIQFSTGRETRRESTFMGTESQEVYPRRPLVAHLVGLRLALRATKPLVSTEAQGKFTALLSAIEPVIQSAGNKDTVDLVLANTVRDMVDAMRRVTAAPAAPVAEPVAPPAK